MYYCGQHTTQRILPVHWLWLSELYLNFVIQLSEWPINFNYTSPPSPLKWTPPYKPWVWKSELASTILWSSVSWSPRVWGLFCFRHYSKCAKNFRSTLTIGLWCKTLNICCDLQNRFTLTFPGAANQLSDIILKTRAPYQEAKQGHDQGILSRSKCWTTSTVYAILSHIVRQMKLQEWLEVVLFLVLPSWLSVNCW